MNASNRTSNTENNCHFTTIRSQLGGSVDAECHPVRWTKEGAADRIVIDVGGTKESIMYRLISYIKEDQHNLKMTRRNFNLYNATFAFPKQRTKK